MYRNVQAIEKKVVTNGISTNPVIMQCIVYSVCVSAEGVGRWVHARLTENTLLNCVNKVLSSDMYKMCPLWR